MAVKQETRIGSVEIGEGEKAGPQRESRNGMGKLQFWERGDTHTAPAMREMG